MEDVIWLLRNLPGAIVWAVLLFFAALFAFAVIGGVLFGVAFLVSLVIS